MGDPELSRSVLSFNLLQEVVYGTTHPKSLLGLMKICEIFLCLLAVILVGAGGWRGDLISAFYAGTIIGIILSLLILVLSSTEAGHSLNGVLQFQYVVHLCLFIYLFIVSAILVSRSSRSTMIGGVFGIIGSIAYLGDALFCYNAYGKRLW